MPKPPLTIVDPGSTGFEPPRQLGAPGRQLWDGIMQEYDIRDRGGIELLCLAAEATDRVQRLAERIAADGEIIRTASGPRAHPGLRDELAGRAFVARTLQRLGLNLDAIKPMGRPPGHGY
jgi:hypothetical protein